jgi:hypothetical protein
MGQCVMYRINTNILALQGSSVWINGCAAGAEDKIVSNNGLGVDACSGRGSFSSRYCFPCV